MCKKQIFNSKQDAINAAEKYMIENGEFSGYRYRAYKCHLCKHWHLTSKKPNIELQPSSSKKLVCDSLVRYKKESEAKMATGATSRTKRKLFYYCTYCFGYHPR